MTDTLARQRQIIGSTAEWAMHDLTLGDGELALERAPDGSIRARVGDGAHHFSASPYLTTTTAPLRYKGEANPALPPPAGALPGDLYSVKPGGVVAASWGPPAAGATVAAGDFLALASDATWHVLPGAVDVSAFITDAELAAPGATGLIGHAGPLGTETAKLALDMARPASFKKLDAVLDKLQAGLAVTIACHGHSLTYGQDDVNPGGMAPINGSVAPRSLYPYPETLKDALSLNQFAVVPTVTNRGYPGDTVAAGFARWAAAPATDVSIHMWDTNDGKVRGTPLPTYKSDYAKFIERDIARGAAVILMTAPPCRDVTTEKNIAAYRAVTRQLAAEYELPLIDLAEQLSGFATKWTDGVHLTSFVYAEIGWQVSALFTNRNLGSHRIAAGSIWYPDDGIGYGGTTVDDANARGGSFIRLTPGQRYTVTAFFEDDCIPVLYSFNSSASDTNIFLQYSGNGTGRGILSPQLKHTASTDNRQALAGPVMRRGFRTFSIYCDTGFPGTANIDAIEFRALDVPMLPLAWRKSTALTNVHFPGSMLAALAPLGTFAFAMDYGLPLLAPYRFSARVQLLTNGGLVVAQNRQGPFVMQDMLFLRRLGNDLVLRDFVGAVPADTVAANAFAAGSFTGEIEIAVTATGVTVYLSGSASPVITYTPATMNNKRGFPGVFTEATQTGFLCLSAAVKGIIKGPYWP